MPRKLTTEKVVERLRERWGHEWDYSNVEYEGYDVPVNVICPNGHSIWLTPDNHFRGHGCFICEMKKRRKVLYGVAIDDREEIGDTESIILWRQMIKRCYDITYKEKHSCYMDVTSCEEWKRFSNFRKWFEDPSNGYKKGYHLDKDILVKGNKIYSPETCCFVPIELNCLLLKSNKCRGKYPIGVSLINGRIVSYISINGKMKHLGYFPTPEEAFQAYKVAKEKYIHDVAQKYFNENKITQRVYDALMKYEVEITD